MSEYGININDSKCVFGTSTLDFRSHKITVDGVQPSTEKVRVIQEFPQPNSIKKFNNS